MKRKTCLAAIAALMMMSIPISVFLARGNRKFDANASGPLTSGTEFAQDILVKTPASPQSGFSDDEFYIFNNVSEIDVFQGGQLFGSQDKTGVDKAVWDALQNELDDFMFIGHRKTDREQFLTAQGVTLQDPNRTWQVEIIDFGIVNGETRVEVMASVGSDVLEQGGIRMGIEKRICEIWKIDLAGSTPTLLDRAFASFNGLMTHAESPVKTYPLATETDTYGNGPPFKPSDMGLDDPE